jgi:hypothetical protein
LALLSFPDGSANQSSFKKVRKYGNAHTFGCSLALRGFCGDHYCLGLDASYLIKPSQKEKSKKK